jgi:hypothetical protein
MNKEFKESCRFGVDFLDAEMGEKIIQIISHKQSANMLGAIVVLTNFGSLYEILGEDAVRINPSLEGVENEK